MELDFTLLFTKKLYNEITDKENNLLQEALSNSQTLQTEFKAFEATFNQIEDSKLEGEPSNETIQNILKYAAKTNVIQQA